MIEYSNIPKRSSPKLPLPIFLPTLQFGPTMSTLELLLERVLGAAERPGVRSSGCILDRSSPPDLTAATGPTALLPRPPLEDSL